MMFKLPICNRIFTANKAVATLMSALDAVKPTITAIKSSEAILL